MPARRKPPARQKKLSDKIAPTMAPADGKKNVYNVWLQDRLIGVIQQAKKSWEIRYMLDVAASLDDPPRWIVPPPNSPRSFSTPEDAVSGLVALIVGAQPE